MVGYNYHNKKTKDSGGFKMAGILYDARRIKAYEGMLALGELAGEDKAWCDALWEEIIFDAELLDELVFYLENHSIMYKMKC